MLNLLVYLEIEMFYMFGSYMLRELKKGSTVFRVVLK